MFGLLLAALLAGTAANSVAVTFDDLPAAGSNNPDHDPWLTTADVQAINSAILKTLRRHHAPAIGFVNERGISGSPDSASRCAVLQNWLAAGMQLGNHGYSHADFNALTVQQFEDEVERGETSIAQLTGHRPKYFRFPMNHTGDTAAKHDAAARFLEGNGYRLATCTIENEDYVFEQVFRAMLRKNDSAGLARLRAEYLRYTAAEIDWYAALHKRIFRRATAQVMLLHANRINAENLDAILRLFEERGYRFVTLEGAQSDPAFQTPTEPTKFGPMWGYRWARVLGVKVDGSKEPEPPEWISRYAAAPAN